jgi:hypothetical protein
MLYKPIPSFLGTNIFRYSSKEGARVRFADNADSSYLIFLANLLRYCSY